MTATLRPEVLPIDIEPIDTRAERAPRVRGDRRTRLARSRRSSTTTATVGAGAVAALVVFALWFRTGAFYAHGDLAPFVRDSVGREAGSLWTHQNTAAGGPTYEVVRVIELAFIRFAHLLGGGDALGERLLFAAVFACAASGVAAVASRFVARAWLVFVAGLLGAFSPLTMVNLPNILIPLGIGMVAWCAALTIDAASGERPTRPRVLAVLSLGFAYLAFNPPLLAIALLWLGVLPFVAAAVTSTGRAGLLRSVGFLGRAALWAIPLSAWWIVPYVITLKGATDAGTITANTNALAWSWAQAHGSLDRVLTLVAKWSWPDPKQAGASSALASPHWLGLAFALPIGLLAAPLVARPSRRRAALWILFGGLVVALVGKGLNAPFRTLNAWGYRHVPGMFLLREPVSKVGTLLVPAVVVGWVLAIDGLVAWFASLRCPRIVRVRIARAGVATLACAPLVFAIPMLTGLVLPGGSQVRVPAAWYQVARAVDDAPARGKAIVLPLDDFYQVPTTWGFYGADLLPARLIQRSTIVRNPQRYIESAGSFDELAGRVESGIVGADAAAVPNALRALGVSEIVVRKDIDFASTIRAVDMVQPAALTAGLAAVPDVRRIASTAVADVYEFTGGTGSIAALTGLVETPPTNSAALASMVTNTPAGSAMVSNVDAGSLANGQALSVDLGTGAGFTPPTAGSWQFARRTADASLFELRGDAHAVVLSDPETVAVAGHALAPRPPLMIPSARQPVAVDVDGTLVDVGAGRAFARVTPGTKLRALTRARTTPPLTWSAVGDCNRYDNTTAPAAALHADILSAPNDPILRLRASRHSACIRAQVPGYAANDVLHISLQQLAVRGAPPRTCLWQQQAAQCAKLAWSVERDGAWYSMSATYRVPPDAGALTEVLYADEPPAGSTTTSSEVQYRRVQIDKLVAGPVTRVVPGSYPTGALALGTAAVPVVSASTAPVPHFGPRSAPGDCARSDDRTLTALGISAEAVPAVRAAADPTAVRLRARADTACVSMPITGMARTVDYELSFTANVGRGAAPRVCLWDATARKCSTLDPTSPTPASGAEVSYRVRVGSDASGLQLFLYADGVAGGTTIDYSNVRLRPIVDGTLEFRHTGASVGVPPQIEWKTDSAARYRVTVANAAQPFVLALSDSYADGWHLRGLPRGARATHIELDGYRNGWVINARGDLNLTLEYTPARLGRDAIHLSQVSAYALVISVLLSGQRFAGRRARMKRRVRRTTTRATRDA